jgi:[protein-PII] uridylyltransferase
MNSDVAALREFIDTERDRIMTRHRYRVADAPVASREIMLQHTALADTVVRRVYGEARDAGEVHRDASVAVIALGGYGREELNPHSDIDMLLLHDPKGCRGTDLEAFASRLITTLWDVGFEVGHAVRTLRECRHAAMADMDSRTAMLEGRLVVGNASFYRRYEFDIKTRAMRRGVSKFISEKIDDWTRETGDPKASVYVQEPNLKEGVGGLREVHISRWVARTRFGVWELSDLAEHGLVPDSAVGDYEAALDFIWRVRNELHYLSRRRADVLSFDMQERVAKELGYVDIGRHLAEEQLMRDYYRHAHWIHECARIVIMQTRWEGTRVRKLLDRLQSTNVTENIITLRDRLRLTPRALSRSVRDGSASELLIDLFRHRIQLKMRLSVATRRQIVEELPAIAESINGSGEVHEAFLGLLAEVDNLGPVLREMHELGVLTMLIPEFAGLRSLVRYDLYHRYTVDEHTLFAVGNLDASKVADAHTSETLAEAYEPLEEDDRVALRVGMLLHDLGKGVPEDGEHIVRGRPLRDAALDRFPTLTEEQRDDIVFLYEQHHLMSHTAQRRDLDDGDVIERFAAEVGSVKRARMLYLLTYADIRAVNPDLWTDWTASLLRKLYMRTDAYFRGDIVVGRDTLERLRGQTLDMMGSPWSDRVGEHFERMGDERMGFFAPEEIVAQVRAVSELGDAPGCSLQIFDRSENYSSAVFAAPDRVGLFARIAGILAAADVNILSADLNTRSDRIAVDTFHITQSISGKSINPNRARELGELISQVAAGETTIEELLAEKTVRTRSKKTRRTAPMAPVVRISNDESAEYTIVHVGASDRVGLLYAVARCLGDMGLDISLAKISTEAYRAVDVFYVTDENRCKILDPGRREEITAALHLALEDED